MNCDHIVNMLTDHFQESFPQYSVLTGEFSRTVNLPSTFDLGFELVFAVGSAPTAAEYDLYQWSSDRLMALLPLSHPLSQAQSISLKDLAADKFILFPESSFLHCYIAQLCERAGFTPKVDFTIHGTRNVAELVSAGLGVSLAPSTDIMTVKRHQVAMVELDPPPLVYLNLYYKKDKPLSDPAKAFLDFAINIHDNHANDIPYMGPETEIGNVYFK